MAFPQRFHYLQVMIFYISLTVCGFGLTSALEKDCICDEAKLCRPLSMRKNTKFEVYAFSNGATDIDKWKWETITTFVAPSTFSVQNKSEASTMCVAHQHGRKFGITVDMDLSGSLNSSSDDAITWIDSAVDSHSKWSADVINVNLLPYFKIDHTSDKNDHIELVLILSKLHKAVDTIHKDSGVSVEISCVVPWKPPCASKESSCDFSSHIMDACDFFVISPDSFLDVENEKCRASATVPFSKLVYGVSEYNAYFLPTNRIILGVTWHGYDYVCSDLTNDVCTVNTVKIENSTVTKCNFSNRQRITYADITQRFNSEATDHKQSDFNNAPFFNYKDGSVSHQVWFEDHFSLNAKYRLIKEFPLAGLAVMYGDDLVPSKKLVERGGMLWSWVAHEFLLSRAQSDETHNLQCANTVAGVAVGCMLLGVLLGVTFTCVTLHKRIRKPKQPLVRDATLDADEYTDEDPNL